MRNIYVMKKTKQKKKNKTWNIIKKFSCVQLKKK